MDRTHPEARIRLRLVSEDHLHSELSASMLHVAGLVAINFPINSFSSWCFQCIFCSRLRVSFSPCDQTSFQIPQHISHPGFQQPSHLHCFQETFEILPPFSPFSGTATVFVVPWQQWGKIPRLQDLEASRQNGCKHYASRVASQKPEKFHEKKRYHSVQAKATASSTNFNFCQYSLQKLITLAPSKKRTVETAISLFHHIIPFRPNRGITTPQRATPRTESSHLHRGRSPWSPKVR